MSFGALFFNDKPRDDDGFWFHGLVVIGIEKGFVSNRKSLEASFFVLKGF